MELRWFEVIKPSAILVGIDLSFLNLSTVATVYNYGSSFISIVIMISSLLDSSSSAFCSTFVKLSLGLLVFKIFASLISYCVKSIKFSTE